APPEGGAFAPRRIARVSGRGLSISSKVLAIVSSSRGPAQRFKKKRGGEHEGRTGQWPPRPAQLTACSIRGTRIESSRKVSGPTGPIRKMHFAPCGVLFFLKHGLRPCEPTYANMRTILCVAALVTVAVSLAARPAVAAPCAPVQIAGSLEAVPEPWRA